MTDHYESMKIVNVDKGRLGSSHHNGLRLCAELKGWGHLYLETSFVRTVNKTYFYLSDTCSSWVYIS